MFASVRRFSCAASAVAIALACVGLMACQDDSSKVASHTARGEAYANEEKHAEAIIEFKNVLQIDPNQGAAHYGLAKSYLATNKLREGYWELRETARLMPGNLDAKLQFGQMARIAGEHEEALKQAEEVIAADASRAPAHVLRGQALELLKRPDEAREAYQKAVELGASDPAPLLMLATFLERNGDRAGAEPLLKKLIEVKPGFAAASTYAAFIARDKSRDAEAEAAFRAALAAATPDELSAAYRSVASFVYSHNRFDEAEQLLREGVSKKPDDLELIYSLARFYAARGEDAKADAMVEEATKAKPGEVDPYLVLSAYRGRKGDLEGALAATESALQAKPDDRRAKLRKAELLLDMGYRAGDKEKIAEGRGITEAILATEAANPEALFVKAKIDLAERRFADAATGLRRALEGKPDWAQARFLLGSALFFDNDREGARAEVQRAIELDADLIDARKLLTRIHASLGSNDLAVEEGRRALAASDDPAIHVIVAQSLVRLGKADDALAQLAKIPDDKRDAEAWYAVGRVQLLKRQQDVARKSLERADQMRPGHPEILNSLLMLDRAEKRLDESLARIERAANAEPANPQLQHLLGIALLYLGRGSDAERMLKRAIELDPTDLAPYQTMAQLLASENRTDEILATYEKAVAAKPDSATLHLVLGTLRESNGQTDQAREHYERAIQLDPNLGPAKNNLAYLLAQRGEQLDRALSLAQEAKAALPDSANAADTLGWVLLKKGVPSAAIGYLREAEGLTKEGDPSLGEIRSHLAQAYEANNEPARAREMLERALGELTPGQPEPAWAADARARLERLPAAPPGDQG